MKPDEYPVTLIQYNRTPSTVNSCRVVTWPRVHVARTSGACDETQLLYACGLTSRASSDRNAPIAWQTGHVVAAISYNVKYKALRMRSSVTPVR